MQLRFVYRQRCSTKFFIMRSHLEHYAQSYIPALTIMSIATMDQDASQASGEKVLKRKRNDQVEELEIDINAAEPPSKKQLRKAKKGKTTTTASSADTGSEPKASDVTVEPGNDANGKPNHHGRSKFAIWIGNLSFATTKDELMRFMTSDTDHPIDKDHITRINLPSGPTRAGKPQNKGFAYIDFIDVTTLNHALQLSEKLFNGRRVLIKDARSFEGRPASKEDVAAGKLPSRRIFIGNLSFDTTSEDLEKHFGVCGKIQKIQVATFEDSGKCKGYAWIEFEQLSSAESAMRGWIEQGKEDNLQQSKRRVWLKKMDGRQLRMEFAEDATTRYNKRYGKDAKGKKTATDVDGEQQAPIEEVEDFSRPVRAPKSKQEDSRPSKRRHGYEKETVQRLTGAITEGQGQKVLFD